jgi:hypothetical protein
MKTKSGKRIKSKEAEMRGSGVRLILTPESSAPLNSRSLINR